MPAVGPDQLQVNEVALRRAWESSQRSTPEDWAEWARHFAVELLRNSPSPALRANYRLAEVQCCLDCLTCILLSHDCMCVWCILEQAGELLRRTGNSSPAQLTCRQGFSVPDVCSASRAAASVGQQSECLRPTVHYQSLLPSDIAPNEELQSPKSHHLIGLSSPHFHLDILMQFPPTTPNRDALRWVAWMQMHPQMARDLFPAGFVSCWGELSATMQAELVRSLEAALASPSIPADIVTALLNLAEFMEHNDKSLPLDTRLPFCPDCISCVVKPNDNFSEPP